MIPETPLHWDIQIAIIAVFATGMYLIASVGGLPVPEWAFPVVIALLFGAFVAVTGRALWRKQHA